MAEKDSWIFPDPTAAGRELKACSADSGWNEERSVRMEGILSLFSENL